MYWRLGISFAFGVGAIVVCDQYLWELPTWGNILLFLFASGVMLQGLERDAANRYLARKGDDYGKGHGD